MRVDREKNIWLGTFGGGLDKFDPTTHQFTRYRFDANTKSTLRNDTIISMCLDHHDDVWIGTQHGLYKLEKKTGRFAHIKLRNRNGQC